MVRTTIDLPEDAYHVAKAHAAERKISLGKAIGELILRPPAEYARARSATGEVRERVAKYPSVHVDQVLTVDRVKRLLDDE
jgi:hypothetical protein